MRTTSWNRPEYAVQFPLFRSVGGYILGAVLTWKVGRIEISDSIQLERGYGLLLLRCDIISSIESTTPTDESGKNGLILV